MIWALLQNFFANSELVIGCDLNVKHLSRGNSTVNGNGTHLFDWISNNVRFSIKGTLKPTSIAEKSATFLDFFITTAFVDIVFRDNYNNCLKTYSYEWDHAAVRKSLWKAVVLRASPIFNPSTMLKWTLTVSTNLSKSFFSVSFYQLIRMRAKIK